MIAMAEALGLTKAAKTIEAVAVKALNAEAQQKTSKRRARPHRPNRPTTDEHPTYLITHTGLNRIARREWKHEQRGISFFSRIASPVRSRQRLNPKRRANRWLVKT